MPVLKHAFIGCGWAILGFELYVIANCLTVGLSRILGLDLAIVVGLETGIVLLALVAVAGAIVDGARNRARMRAAE